MLSVSASENADVFRRDPANVLLCEGIPFVFQVGRSQAYWFDLCADLG